MPSFFGGVEVEPKKVEEKSTPVITSAPETKESKFGGVLVGEQKVEQPRPGGGLVEDQTFLKKAEPATLWEKAKNLMRDPDKESAKAVQALVDSEAFGVRPHEALEYQDVIAKGTKINAQALSLRSDWTDRVNQSWETGKKQNYIGEIGYKYITTGDPRFLEQMRNVSLPTAEETFISKSVLEDSVRSAAKLMPMVIETGTESVGKGMKVGMGFGLITALLGQAGPQAALPEEILTVPAATLAGFKIGATAGAFEASLRKEGGLALSEIINFKDEEGNEIDPNIARATAFGIGAINAGIEVAQLRLLINTVPGMSKLFSEATMEVVAGKAVKDKLLALAGKFAGTVATETAQEVAQESTNIVFEELAKSVNNKLLDTDILPTDVETVLNRLEETMIESAQGFAVIALPGTLAKAGLVRGEKAEVAPGEAAQEAPGDIIEDARTEEQILKSIEGQDTIEDTEIDNLLNIDEAEIDAEIDRIVLGAETVEEIAPEAPGEIGPRTQVFQEQVAAVVGEEEATAVNTLLDARAKAAGMTTDEYIDFHGLEIVEGPTKADREAFNALSVEGDVTKAEEQTGQAEEIKASVTFTDTKTIIRAFETADVSSLVHELGHVFRRDLGGDELATVETWAGVEDGTWTVDAEEKFARGWENYLATGEAPTAELQSIFEKFKKWMSEIYNSIKGSSIDVDITPEIKAVFDRLLIPAEEVAQLAQAAEVTDLAERNKLRVEIESINTELGELKAKDPAKRTATDIKKIKSLESRKPQVEKLIEEGGAFVESLPRAKSVPAAGPASTKIALKKAISNARKALAKGDAKGVARERARIKEIVARATSRRKKFASVRSIKAKIKKELKLAKVKKQSGKPVGKFTPEIQDILNTLISASKLKPAEAEARIAKNLEQYQNEPPPQEVVIENHMLEMVARLDTMKDPESLQNLLDEIKALKDEGRLTKSLRDFNRSEQTRARVEATVEDLGGVPEGARITGIKDFVPTSTTAKIKRALKTLGKTIVGWDDLMDILSFGTKTAPGESFISRDNDLLGTKNEEKRGTRVSMETVNNLYMDAFGLKSGRQVIKKVQDDNSTEITLKKVPMTSPVDGSYLEMDLKFTKAEMRKRAMELSDPSLTASFVEMGYNEDTKAFIFQSLTDEDKTFMKSQLEFYGDFYEGTNDVYKAMYGVNLPKNEFYTPISREGISKPVDDGMGEFMKEMSFRASAASAGALKSRVGSTLTISKQSDISMLERHITEMEHFKAWGERIRDLNAVWKNPDVRAAVEINHGKDVLGLVDNFISDIAAGSSQMGQKLKGLDLLRVNFTKSVLAVNPDVTIKQLTSFVAYGEKMPAPQFVKYLVKFWANPIENMRTIYTSELMKARAGNIERDIKAAMNSTEKKAFGNDQSLINMLLLNIKIGDQGAIVIGGWAYYQWLRDVKNLSHDQAINNFEKFTENTQQSADITEQSYWQRGGSLAKLVTMFASSPNQYLRKEIGALRNLAAGRQGVKQTAKTLIIYHTLLPMFFQFVSDRFTWDEDEQKRAFIFGALNGWFIVGDGLDYILRQMLGMRTFNMELPVYSVFHDFIKATDIVDLFDLSAEEFFKAVRGVAGVAGAATGIPFKQFLDESKGVADVLDGQYEEGLTELMGYSPYLAEKLSKD